MHIEKCDLFRFTSEKLMSHGQVRIIRTFSRYSKLIFHFSALLFFVTTIMIFFFTSPFFSSLILSFQFHCWNRCLDRYVYVFMHVCI